MSMRTHTKTIIAVLEGAKDNLLTYGWRRHSYGNESEGYCLMGAVNREAHKRKTPYLVRLEVQSLLERQIQMDYEIYSPVASRWNDMQRDKRKVIRLIDRTIRNLEKGKIEV